MSELGKFIAFVAAVALIAEGGYEGLLEEVAAKCKEALKETKPVFVNRQEGLRELHCGRTFGQGCRIGLSDNGNGKVPVEIVYQSIENLHDRPRSYGRLVFYGRPSHPGRVPGGSQGLLNFYEKKEGRSYERRFA